MCYVCCRCFVFYFSVKLQLILVGVAGRGGGGGGGGGRGGGEDVGEEESKNNLFLVYTVSNLKHTSIANIFTNTTFPTTLSWFIPF